jgi:hypothetical protein
VRQRPRQTGKTSAFPRSVTQRSGRSRLARKERGDVPSVLWGNGCRSLIDTEGHIGVNKGACGR